MPLKVTCPKCRVPFQLPHKPAAGATLKCPKCAKSFSMPAAPSGKPVAAGASARAAAKTLPAIDMVGVLPTSGNGSIVALPDAVRKAKNSFGVRLKRFLKWALLGTLVLVVLLAGLYFGGKFAVGAVMAWMNRKDEAKTTQVAQTAVEPTQPKEPTVEDTRVNPSTGSEDALAFVPPDSNLIIGINGAALLDNPLSKPLVENALVNLGLVTTLADCKNQTGLDLKWLLDSVVIAIKTPAPFARPEHVTYILTTSVNFDQKKLGKWASSDPPKRAGNKIYYDKHREMAQVNTVYMPSNRIIVLSDLPAPTFAAAMSADGTKPWVPADVVPLIRQVEKNLVWMVWPFDKQTIQAGGGPVQLFNVLMPPEVQGTLRNVLPQSRGATLRLAEDKKEYNVWLGLDCGTDKLAGDLAKVLQNSWTRHKPQAGKKISNAIVFQALERQEVVKQMMASMQFANQASLTEAAWKIDADAFKALFKGEPDAMPTHVLETLAQLGSDLKLPLVPERASTMSPEEKMLIDLVNDYRTKEKKLPPLKPHPKLMEVARAHAANMAKQQKEEDELDGKDTPTRVKEAGYQFKKDALSFNMSAVANLGPKEVFDLWLKMGTKIDNITGDFEETGVGVAKNAETGQIYYYQIYAERDR